MVSKVCSISVPEDLLEYVEADPDLKLSKICQTAIKEIMDRRNTDPLIERLNRKIKFLEEEIQKTNEKN